MSSAASRRRISAISQSAPTTSALTGRGPWNSGGPSVGRSEGRNGGAAVSGCGRRACLHAIHQNLGRENGAVGAVGQQQRDLTKRRGLLRAGGAAELLDHPAAHWPIPRDVSRQKQSGRCLCPERALSGL